MKSSRSASRRIWSAIRQTSGDSDNDGRQPLPISHQSDSGDLK